MKGASSSSSIPSKMRETVQNLKEIVNCTEQDVYSMLRECNMDPSETVHRLLNQDTFHEVKSKREKKKETKASGESRSQRVSSTSGRGVRVGPDHAGRSVPQINSNDCEVTRAKHVHVGENGAKIDHTSSGFGSGGTTNNSSALSTSTSSYNGDVGNAVHFPGLTDSISLPSQPSSTVQNKWLGVPGQHLMADVVKMGRSQRKPSNREVRKAVLHQSVVPNTTEGSASARCISTTVISLEATQETHSLHDNVFKVTEGNNEPSIVVGQHEPLEEWTLVDHSTEENYHEPSASTSLHIDEIDSHLSLNAEDIRKLGCVGGKSISTESTISDGHVKLDGSERSSFSDDGSFTSISSDQQDEAEDVHKELSSATANLHRLSLHKEEQDEASAVIIPSDLQDTHADCSHLSFGSFGLGVSASKSNLEVISVTENVPPVDYLDTRNLACYNTEQLRTTSDNNDLSITSKTCWNSDVVSRSQPQPELRRDDTAISEQKLKFNMPSVSSVASSVTVQPSEVDYKHKHAQQPHLESTSLNLLVGNAQPLREPELPTLHFRSNQSVSTKYIPAVPSSTGTTISLPELIKSGLYSNFQSIPQTTSSTTISSVPTLTSYNLPVTYYQPTHPLGPMANRFKYPGLPQNIAYMQTPAWLQSERMKYTIPKNKPSMPLIPQSHPVGSGYGGYGSSTNSSRTFLQNPLNVAAGMSVGYEEALRSQYKEGVPLQQDGNIPVLLRRLDSRPQPAAPTSSFYGIQEQGHQGSNIFRPAQHPPQMGTTGYANLYYTQQLGGISHEPQQFVPILQKNINGSQGQSSQQSYQHWPHIY